MVNGFDTGPMTTDTQAPRSKISRRLKEPLAKEICDHIYAPRISRDFIKQFSYLTDVNQAHLLMLHRQQLLSPQDARQLAQGLLRMEEEGSAVVPLDPEREDPYMNYEAHLMTIAGRDVGGRLHMARSRNDLAATIDRMRTRSLVLDVLEAIGRVREVALQGATRHADVVMPGYTHLQPAQPITFGFYLAGVAQSLGRDMERLQASLAHVDSSPLGAGALAGTRFAIDRTVTATALGFGSVAPNTLDAVASRDFAWEAMSAMAIVAVTWGRVAQDFHVWSTQEFALVSFPDRVSGTSSIMPQKKNPAVLEFLKGKSSHVIALLMNALVAVKGTNFSHSGDGNRESIRAFWECGDETLRGLALLELMIGAVEPQQAHMLRRVRGDFSVATDLADGLVADGLSFRDAHHVVGGLVRSAGGHRQVLRVARREIARLPRSRREREREAQRRAGARRGRIGHRRAAQAPGCAARACPGDARTPGCLPPNPQVRHARARRLTILRRRTQ
jgi:argininosuccinate lyase